MESADLIKSPNPVKDLRKRKYNTNDIISLVQEVISTHVADTEAFAKSFPKGEEGLRQLYNYVDRNFQYQEDPPGSQWVQTPAWLNKSKVGDCKSYTVFISSVLQNMGIKHVIRYVSYGTKNYRHVYPVAIIGKREIPLDVVWKKQENGRYGAEKPYRHKKDYAVEGLYKLGNTYTDGRWDANEYIGQLEATIEQLEEVKATIPNVPGPDVTEMTAGELDRFLYADRYEILAKQAPSTEVASQYRAAATAMKNGDIAGIGSLQGNAFGKQVAKLLAETAQKNRPAFEPFTVSIPNPVPPSMSGLFKSIGKFVKKVANTISDVFKSFVNWIFKGVGKKMGPFFIFQFLTRNKVKSPAIKQRIEAQDKSYNFIKKLGKFDDKQLKGLMLNGILEETGKDPKQIAQESGVPEIGALPAVIAAVIKAIGFVVQVVGKIASIFKRPENEAGLIGESTMSDPVLFEEEARLQRQATAPAGGGGGFNPLILASLAIPLLLKA